MPSATARATAPATRSARVGSATGSTVSAPPIVASAATSDPAANRRMSRWSPVGIRGGAAVVAAARSTFPANGVVGR